MNDLDISNALQKRLFDAGLATVVFENDDAAPTRPFLYCEYVPTEYADAALSGGQKTVRGYLSVIVVIDQGVFSSPAHALADQIEGLFPKATRIAITGGTVTISDAVVRLKGYQADGEYRLPLRIPFVAA